MFPEQIKGRGFVRGHQSKLMVVHRSSEFPKRACGDHANHTWGPVGVTNHVSGKWEPGKPSVTVEIPSGTYDTTMGETYSQVSTDRSRLSAHRRMVARASRFLRLNPALTTVSARASMRSFDWSRETSSTASMSVSAESHPWRMRKISLFYLRS